MTEQFLPTEQELLQAYKTLVKLATPLYQRKEESEAAEAEQMDSVLKALSTGAKAGDLI